MAIETKKLLNLDTNAKTVKGQKKGYLTGILYLAPANLSGFETCPNRSKGCGDACLYSAGRGRFDNVQEARIRKTVMFFKEREAFMALLVKEIERGIRKADRKGMNFTVRLNGTSDIAFENMGIMQKFPNIQFYDYSKSPFRMNRFLSGGMPKNYHLTFSLNEDNMDVAMDVLSKGGNVAMVFATNKVEEFPTTYKGYPVVSGDETDLRFLDTKNVIVALKAKGQAKKDTSGFVQPLVNDDPDQAVANA
jgi:hypothetical protein